MGDAGCCGNKFAAFCGIIGEECADNRAPHGRPVAGGKHAAPVRKKSHPELENGSQCGEADSGGNAEEPEAQFPSQASLEWAESSG